MAATQRETKDAKIANSLTVQVAEIRSGDKPIGLYYGGFWHGYELRIHNTEGQVLDTAQIETWGYPVGASIDISPDGRALAVVAEGNDGFEQEDNTIGVFEVSKEGKIQTLHKEQRESGRIVISRPHVSWIQDHKVVVKWTVVGTSSSTEPETIMINRSVSNKL